MAVATEIERRFLLEQLPQALAFARRKAILQGYLAVDGRRRRTRHVRQAALRGALG